MRTIAEITSQYDFSGLNRDEKGLLGEYLRMEAVNVPQWHIDELEKIDALDRAGKITYSSWEDVKKRIVSKYAL